MRFIGAMINVIGNLLPIRAPTAGASQSTTGSGGNGAAETAPDPALGSFTSTLLQILKATGGSAAMAEGDVPQTTGKSTGPGQEPPGLSAQAGQIPAQLPGTAASEPQLPVGEDLDLSSRQLPASQGPPESSFGLGRPQAETGSPGELRELPESQEPPQVPWRNGVSRSGELTQKPEGTIPAVPLRGSGNPQGPPQIGQDLGTAQRRMAEGMGRLDGQASVTPRQPGSEQRVREEGLGPARPPAPQTTDQIGKSGFDVEATKAVEIPEAGGPEGNRPVNPSSAHELGNPNTDAPVSGDAISTSSETAPTPLEAVSRSNRADDFPMDRNPEKLAPDFRQRLDRVVSRMEKEFGHTVTMVEGYRAPERQTAIYAQGRTAPGPVATWTQESLHSQGRAADLMVDGTWKNPAGYARLQQVAKEEGLGVLGSKDPGHVELPVEGAATRGARTNQSWMPTGQNGSGMVRPSVPRPAAVARPASARVATAARVARPARPGQSWNAQASASSSTVSASTAQQTAEVSQPLPPTPHVPKLNLQAGLVEPAPAKPIPGPGPVSAGAKEPIPGPLDLSRVSGVEEVSNSKGRQTLEAAPVTTSQNNQGTEADPVQPGLMEVRPTQAQAPSATDTVQRVNTAQRVNDILSMGETWESQALGRIHLDMEDVDGAGTRIRLAMRGSELAGSLDLSDPALATRMRERIGELHEALSRQGLDAQGLEARALTGVEGRAGADGEMANLMKDPLTGLARLLEVRDSGVQSRGDEQRNSRHESQRGDERFNGERSRQSPERNPNKENKR